MSAIQPLSFSTRSARAGSCALALASNPSSQAFSRSEAPTLRTKWRMRRFGLLDPRMAFGSELAAAV
jgi:hypothetical protein